MELSHLINYLILAHFIADGDQWWVAWLKIIGAAAAVCLLIMCFLHLLDYIKGRQLRGLLNLEGLDDLVLDEDAVKNNHDIETEYRREVVSQCVSALAWSLNLAPETIEENVHIICSPSDNQIITVVADDTQIRVEIDWAHKKVLVVYMYYDIEKYKNMKNSVFQKEKQVKFKGNLPDFSAMRLFIHKCQKKTIFKGQTTKGAKAKVLIPEMIKVAGEIAQDDQVEDVDVIKGFIKGFQILQDQMSHNSKLLADVHMQNVYIRLLAYILYFYPQELTDILLPKKDAEAPTAGADEEDQSQK